MATLIPSLGSCTRRMTAGECRFAQRLEDKLEDDYACWYDVPVGPKQLHPDFIVLHAGRGLLIVEVKDWTLETIHAADRASFTLHTAQGLKHVVSPIEQARQYAFAVTTLLERDPALRVAEEDGVPLVEPSSAGRHGPPPELVRLPSLKAEARFIAERLKALHAGGRAWSEMAVVYRSQFVGEEATVALRAAGIPVEWLQERKTRRPFDAGHESVKVLTMHSSKGLEFPVVAVPGIGFMPHEKEAPEDEARLLYVAMTRAMDQLLMTCHRPSAFAERVESACVRQAVLGVPAGAVEARGAARRGLLSSVIQKAQSFLQ